LAIALYVLLRLTDYDYPFGIFKLFVHGRIISLRGDAWAHITSLTLLPVIKVPLPSQESGRLCIYVVKVSILPLSTILMLNFVIFQTPWSFCFSFSYLKLQIGL
jgi:hypothetical protein